MKKIFTLLTLLLLMMTVVVNAQITQTNTQFPNPGFEKWTDHHCNVVQGTTSLVPDNWHTFDQVLYEATNVLGSEELAKTNCHYRLDGNNAYRGDYSWQLSSHNVNILFISVLANGTATTGRTRVKSTTVEDYTNFNFSTSNYRWPFVGCPDSLSFYYKTSWSTVSEHPLLKVYLHTGDFYDHANGREDCNNNSGNPSQSCLIAKCVDTFNVSPNGWSRRVREFYHYTGNNVDNNYGNIERPQYILASFSTNVKAGGGTKNDKLSLDELWCIYDKGLKTLTVDGVSTGDAAAMKTYFNNQEFLTHEPTRTYDGNGNPIFNNSGSASYTWPVCVNANAIPTIAAVPKSKLITGFQIQQAVYTPGASSATATISVTHNDNSTFVYSIVFNIAPATPTITGATSACDDGQVLLTSNNPNTVWYLWGVPRDTGATYIATFNGKQSLTYEYQCRALVEGCLSDAVVHNINVEYVQAPTVTKPTKTNICGSDSTTISATGVSQLFYWSYDGNLVQSTTEPSGSNDYTTTLSEPGNYTYYCYTKNSASSSCKSANVPVQTITVHPAVYAPTNIQNASVCLGQPVTLSVTPSAGATCRWYAAANGGEPLYTGETYSPTIIESGNFHFYATSYNSTTQCESERVEVSATVKQTPAAPTGVTTPMTLCETSTASLVATPAANATLKWYANAQAVGTTSPLAVNGIYSDTTFTVVSVLNGCESSPVTLQILVGNNPAVPTVTNNTLCGPGTVTLRASSSEGNIYWYASNTTSQVSAQDIDTFDVTRSAAGTVTYYVSARSQVGCASSRVPVTATFYALPTAPTTTAVSHCGTYEDLTLTSNPNANTHWYSDALGENELANTTVNVENTTTYYVAVTDEHQCQSALTPLTVTIHTIPGKPVTDTVICKGTGNVTLTATPGANGTACYWYSEIGGTATQNSSYTVSKDGAYYVTSHTENNCESAPVKVTVTTKPSVPSANDVLLCAAGNATMAVQSPAQDVTYTWYANEALTQVVGTGSSIEQNVSATTSYYVTAKRGACESAAKTVVVTVHEVVPAPILSEIIYACNGSVTLPSVYNANNLTWKDAEQIPLQNLTVNMAENSSSVFTATYKEDNCESQPANVTVSYAALPTITNVAGAARCGAGTVVLAATSANSTIYWFDNLSAANSFTGVESSLASGNEYTTASLNSTKTYYLKAVSEEGCLSTVSSAVATVNYNNDNLTVTNITNCGPGTFTLMANGSSNTLTWYADEQGENAVNSTQEIAQTTSFYVASTDANGCRSALKKLDVTIHAIPALPTVAQVPVVCGSGKVQLTASTNETNAYAQWYDANGILSQGSYWTPELSTSTTYFVSTINSLTTCESEKTPVTVVVGAVPAVPQVTSNSHCGPGSVALSAVAADGCFVIWTSLTKDSVAAGNNFAPELANTTTFYAANKNQTTGCVSTSAAVTATIFPVYTDVEDVQIACDEYTWQGDIYTENGRYTKTLQTVNGCDSIVTLDLTIHHSVATYVDTVVCDQFVWNGQSYTESGVLEHTYSTYQNCDSVVTVNLTVKKSSSAVDTMTVCSNVLPVIYHGHEYTSAGTYTVVIPNAVGCDSVITFTLRVYQQPAVPTVTGAARCGAGSVTLTAARGANATECRWYAGEHTETVLSHENRYQPSVNETTIYYSTSYNTNTNCESERVPVTATVNVFPAAPVVNNQARCGSGAVTISAEIDNNATTCRWYRTVDASVSFNEGLTYMANFSDDQSYFVESYNAQTGCSSTTRTECFVFVYDVPTTPVVSPVSNCGPQTFAVAKPATGDYRWYDASMSPLQLQSDEANYYTGLIPQSSILKVTRIEAYDEITCESTPSNFNITIYPVYQTQTIYDTVCQNTPYNRYGINETFAESGVFLRTLNSVSSHGCDSVVVLSITVKPVIHYRFSDYECDEYFWNNIRYTQSGSYTQTFTAANGCDSIVTLDLSIYPSRTYAFYDTACERYTWNRKMYISSGTYVQNLKTSQGCDSVVTLHLTIYKPVEKDVYVTACDQYIWNNETYTQSGTYTKEFETVHHCDSTVNLHLTINHSDYMEYSDVACTNTAYRGYGFDTTLTRTGEFTLVHNSTNVNGCDSTTVLHLTVYPVYHENYDVVICATAIPYHWRGKEFTEAGTYVYNHTTVHGCDSIVTLNLTISSAYENNIVAHICQGEVYTQNDFNTAEPGRHEKHLFAHNGCDSIVTLNLFVHSLDTTRLSDAICQNEPYSRYGFQDVSTEEVGTRTYTRVVPTQYGCDSTVILTLTVNPVYDLYFSDAICLGERYSADGFDTLPQTTGVCTVVRTLTTANGCDSVRTLTLNVLPTYHQSLRVETCDNEPYLFGDTILTQSTQYSYNFHTIQGCDSIVDLTLVVYPTYHQLETLTICENELPYRWRDTVFAVGTQSGEIVFNRQTENGCDSIVTLALTVYPKFEVDDVMDFCQSNTTYNYHDSIIDLSEPVGLTLLTVSYESQYGCDSVYTLQYAVHPIYYKEESVETCDNVPYVWEGHNNVTIPTEAGEYVIYDTLHTSFGCDSVTVLFLTIKPVQHTSVNASICNGESYWFNEREYVRTGSYPVTLTSSLNCDSVVTLNLTVNPTYRKDTTITVCQGALPYYFNGQQFNMEDDGTTKLVSLQTVAGCDSVYNVHFYVEAFNQDWDEVTICDNQLPYAYQDSLFTEAGVYQVVHTEEDGCNTIVTLTLNVNPTYLHYDTVYTCANKLPYHYGTTSLEAAGTQTIHFSTARSCDSAVVVTLIVEPNATSVDEVYVCANDFPIMYGDSMIDEQGSYTIVFARENECDSIVSLSVFEAPVYLNEETRTVCSYELPLTWRNQSIAAAGVYYDSLTTQLYGCDSVYKLTLSVTPSMLYTDAQTTCAGEIIEWRGRQLTQSGVYTDTVENVETGCYDIYMMTATFNPSYHFDIVDTICAGQVYSWRGRDLTASTQISDRFQTAEGCDSIYTLKLVVNPTYQMDTTVVVCNNALPVLWRGAEYNISGVYYDSLQTVAGCDSVYMMVLTVNPSYHFTDTMAFCQNNSTYSYHGEVISLAQPVVNAETSAIFETIAGCDSIYTLTYTVNPAYLFEDVAETCDNEPYVWNGHERVVVPTAAGYYQIYDSLQTINGCDSIWKLTLTVHPTYFMEEVAETCGNEPYVWEGHNAVEIPTTAGAYVLIDTLHGFYGCDSVCQLNLTVNPTYLFEDTMAVCDNEFPFVWRGMYLNESGTRKVYLQTTAGCDSVYSMTLIVNPTYRFNEQDVICSSEIPYLWRGHNYSESGVYYDSLVTANGCDSVYTLTLTVNPSHNYYDTAATCSNEPYTWRGLTLNATGLYTDTVPNMYGCNDVYHLSLTVNQTATVTIYDTICQGYPYTQYGFDTLPEQYGVLYDQQILQTVNGCDSIVNLVLTINRTYQVVTNAETCDNTPYEWRGHEYDEAGVYYDTLVSSTGCDSVLVLNLLVTPTYEIFVEDTAVRTHEYNNYGLSIIPNEAGDFSYDIQNFTVNGCDSIVHLTLHVRNNDGVVEYVDDTKFSFYPNPTADVLNIKGENMQKVFIYNAVGQLLKIETTDDDTSTQLNFHGYATGYYLIRLQLTDGHFVHRKIMVRHN